VREIGGGQRAAVALHGGAEQHVLELADIARPAVAHQHRERVVADRQRRMPGLLGDPGEQVAGERRDVAAAVAQRRDLAGLERAQQLDLGVERKLADLVEEQGRAVGILEAADMAVEGAGEGALLMAEQHRFDEIFRDRAAIDGDHRLAAARGGGVDRLGDHFLARAALALDQHRDPGPGRLGGDRESGTEARRRADDLLEGEGPDRDLLGQRAKLAAAALAAVGGGVQGGEQRIGRDRLDQEIVGAGAHRLDRDRDRGLGGHHQQRQIGAHRPHLLDDMGPVRTGQPMVEEDGVDGGTVHLGEDLRGRVDVGRSANPPAGAGADGGDEPALGGLVVDQQQAACRIRPHRLSIHGSGKGSSAGQVKVGLKWDSEDRCRSGEVPLPTPPRR
jgi:hypothetical protein